jgi:hypothetical protein
MRKNGSSNRETNFSSRLVFEDDIKGDLIWMLTNIRKLLSEMQGEIKP